MNDFPKAKAKGIPDLMQKVADLKNVAGVSTEVELLKKILEWLFC